MVREISVHYINENKTKLDFRLYSNIEDLDMEEIVAYFKRIGYVEGNAQRGDLKQTVPIEKIAYINHKTRKLDEGKRYFF